MASPFRRPLVAGCALALGAALALTGCERGSDAIRATAENTVAVPAECADVVGHAQGAGE